MLQTCMNFQPRNDADEFSNDDDEFAGQDTNLRPKSSFSSSQYKELRPADEIAELFQFIEKFKPQEIDLDTELKPFIPDLIPAIGDIDAFIKVRCTRNCLFFILHFVNLRDFFRFRGRMESQIVLG